MTWFAFSRNSSPSWYKNQAIFCRKTEDSSSSKAVSSIGLSGLFSVGCQPGKNGLGYSWFLLFVDIVLTTISNGIISFYQGCPLSTTEHQVQRHRFHFEDSGYALCNTAYYATIIRLMVLCLVDTYNVTNYKFCLLLVDN